MEELEGSILSQKSPGAVPDEVAPPPRLSLEVCGPPLDVLHEEVGEPGASCSIMLVSNVALWRRMNVAEPLNARWRSITLKMW